MTISRFGGDIDTVSAYSLEHSLGTTVASIQEEATKNEAMVMKERMTSIHQQTCQVTRQDRASV